MSIKYLPKASRKSIRSAFLPAQQNCTTWISPSKLLKLFKFTLPTPKIVASKGRLTQFRPSKLPVSRSSKFSADKFEAPEDVFLLLLLGMISFKYCDKEAAAK